MKSSPLEVVFVEAGNQAAIALMAHIHTQAFSPQGEQPWSSASITQLLASPGFGASLYYSGDLPVGFALTRCVLDEAELISIAVDPRAQGKGFAKQMLRLLIAWLKTQNIRNFFLEVREDNQKAVQLYQRVGFNKIGERKKYYQTMDGKKIDAHAFSLIVE